MAITVGIVHFICYNVGNVYRFRVLLGYFRWIFAWFLYDYERISRISWMVMLINPFGQKFYETCYLYWGIFLVFMLSVDIGLCPCFRLAYIKMVIPCRPLL